MKSSMMKLQALFVFLFFTSAPAADFFVDGTSGIDDPGCGTPARPWASINYALDHITGSQTTPHNIYIATGTYSENVVIDSYESLYGGYDRTTWSRHAESSETIIRPTQAGSAVVLNEGCTIDGLTIINGNRDNGGGVYCRSCYAVISNCIITRNESKDGGSAIYIEDGQDVKITSNRIIDNTSTAVLVRGGRTYFEDNVIADTKAPGFFGWPAYSSGLMIQESATVNLTQDRILRNASYGIEMRDGTASALSASSCVIAENLESGIYMTYGSGTISFSNCLICRNNVGVFAWGHRFSLIQCVVCQNGGNSGAIAGHSSNYMQIQDSVLVANQSDALRGNIGCDFTGGETILKNNFIVSNGIIQINSLSQGGLPLISTNNSILFNKGGYYIYSLNPNRVTLTNDLIWGNDDDIKFIDIFGNPMESQQNIAHCNIEDGDLSGSYGNISVNPDFVGQVGLGSFDDVRYDNENCRTTITDNHANYTHRALARTFLWTNDTPFYVEDNTDVQITVYGDITQVASAGFDYKVMDYHLQPLSMCVDAGTNVNVPDHDFEKDPRPVQGKNANLADIGADEYVPNGDCTSIPVGDLNEDCIVNMLDLAILVSHWLECNRVQQ